jgi:hypothetical protein
VKKNVDIVTILPISIPQVVNYEIQHTLLMYNTHWSGDNSSARIMEQENLFPEILGLYVLKVN